MANNNHAMWAQACEAMDEAAGGADILTSAMNVLRSRNGVIKFEKILKQCEKKRKKGEAAEAEWAETMNLVENLLKDENPPDEDPRIIFRTFLENNPDLQQPLLQGGRRRRRSRRRRRR